MRNIVEEYGYNAGRIWKELSKCSSLTRDKLLEKTRLREEEFSAAVGWLARENKIFKDGLVYKLGETNLVDKIGGDAGKIWEILNTWGEVDLPYIPKLASIKKLDMYSALGWLAREGNIKSKRIRPIEPQIKFELR